MRSVGAILTAVHVLTHESMHLAGVVDEAEADCLAVQSDAWVAGALGADARFARAFAREYWIAYYPSQEPRYRSPDCRDGRRLDLFAGRCGWPVPGAAFARTTDRCVSGRTADGR